MFQKHPEFTCMIATDLEGDRVGCIWMTGPMRRAFKLCRECLFLDAMKRQLDSEHWPCFRPVVLHGERKIQVLCKVLLTTESVPACSFLLQALFEMAPRRKTWRSFSPMGLWGVEHCWKWWHLETCSYVCDLHHLTNRDWPDCLGLAAWHKLSKLFSKCIHSTSEETCKKSAQVIWVALSHCVDWLQHFEREVHDKKLLGVVTINKSPWILVTLAQVLRKPTMLLMQEERLWVAVWNQTRQSRMLCNDRLTWQRNGT